MKKNETKKLTKGEILKNLDKLKKDLFNFRFQKINGQVKNPAKINLNGINRTITIQHFVPQN